MIDFNSIESELISFEQITEFDKKTLNKLFNSVEDLCHVYDKSNSKQQKEIERYLSKLSLWVKDNKSKFDSYSHKFLSAFDFIQKDLSKIDNIVAEIITPIKSETIDNWISLYKSSDMFYTIQGNHKDNSQIFQISDIAFENAYKSVRTEKIGSYHVYIMSGHASKDYVQNASGEHYLQKANKILNKNLDEINPSGKLDGEISNGEKRFILFATSDLNMSSQNIAPHLSSDCEFFVVVNALFNQNYSPTETYYNGRKAEQHGTSFLNQFRCTDFNKDELGLLNVLPVMSLINNTKCPNDSYAVTDLTKINPFVIGTDTYFLYKAFRDIGEYDEPEKTQKLMEFYVSYINSVINKVSKINKDFNFSEDTLTIFENVEKTLIGVLKNFNKSNLPNELPDSNTLNSLFDSIKKFKHTIGLASNKNKHNITLIDDTILENIDSVDDLIDFFVKKNKKINTHILSVE